MLLERPLSDVPTAGCKLMFELLKRTQEKTKQSTEPSLVLLSHMPDEVVLLAEVCRPDVKARPFSLPVVVSTDLAYER